MKTITINAYKIDELDTDVQEIAHREYLENEDFSFLSIEFMQTLEKGLEMFGTSLQRNYSFDFIFPSQSHFEIKPIADWDKISYLRLRTWIINNIYFYLYKRKEYTFSSRKFFSKIFIEEKDCPFTGMCYDEAFLKPVRDFLRNPTSIELEELIHDCVYSLLHAVSKDYEFFTSLEYFHEVCSANDFLFDEKGRRIIF